MTLCWFYQINSKYPRMPLFREKKIVPQRQAVAATYPYLYNFFFLEQIIRLKDVLKHSLFKWVLASRWQNIPSVTLLKVTEPQHYVRKTQTFANFLFAGLTRRRSLFWPQGSEGFEGNVSLNDRYTQTKILSISTSKEYADGRGHAAWMRPWGGFELKRGSTLKCKAEIIQCLRTCY